MGVTILQPYYNSENKSGAVIIDQLSKRLLALGAIHTGQFLVDCESFGSTTSLGPIVRTVHILHDSEFPVTTFAVVDNGAGKLVPVVADNIFDLLMLKLPGAYTAKKQTKIESRGPRFEYGDFLIKLGLVTMVEQYKGVLIEIEYRPCVMLSYCWDMIREMLGGFLGMSVHKDYPAYFAPQTVMNSMGQAQLHQKQNDIFEPIDTINQYLEQFTNYRKHIPMHGAMSGPMGGGGMGVSSGVGVSGGSAGGGIGGGVGVGSAGGNLNINMNPGTPMPTGGNMQMQTMSGVRSS